jgi:hypothetical protein
MRAAAGLACLIRTVAGTPQAVVGILGHARRWLPGHRAALKEDASLRRNAVNQVRFPLEPSRGVLRSGLEVIKDAGDLRASNQDEFAAMLVLQAVPFTIVGSQLELQWSDHL